MNIGNIIAAILGAVCAVVWFWIERWLKRR